MSFSDKRIANVEKENYEAMTPNKLASKLV
jgi:hypothetical protein